MPTAYEITFTDETTHRLTLAELREEAASITESDDLPSVRDAVAALKGAGIIVNPVRS